MLASGASRYRIVFEPHAGGALAWLHGQGAVLKSHQPPPMSEGSVAETDSPDSLEVIARLTNADRDRFQHRYAREIRDVQRIA